MRFRFLGPLLPILLICGCKGPEDGRPRGGGPGGDGGNYTSAPTPVPSKLDGSKPVPSLGGAAR